MKCVVLLLFVATLYVVSADVMDKTLKEAMETIEQIAKRTAKEQEQLARREAGIHINGQCSGLGESCSVVQHCCGEFDCKTENNWYGAFGGTCKNP